MIGLLVWSEPAFAESSTTNLDTELTESTLAPRGDDIKTFTIGDLPAIALRDSMVMTPNNNKIFGFGHTPEEVATVLHAAGLPSDNLHLSVQLLLVQAAGRVLLFDTGMGFSMPPHTGRLMAALATAGVTPQSITDVFLSHVHGDHIGGLINAHGTLAFPNATIHLSEPEWAFFEKLGADAPKKAAIFNYPVLFATIKPKVITFESNAELIPGVVKAVEIKGHTPGHSGYLIGSGEQTLLYIGDAMHHHVLTVRKPEWTDRTDSDTAVAAASREVLLEQSAVSGQRIYAVHFPFPGIGTIARRGEGYIWIPE